jgi:hypothetical protein
LANAIGFIGQPLKFMCKAQGAPCPTYQWYKDGVLLVSSSSYSIDNVGGALIINTLDASLTGQYSCVATNQIQGQAGALGSVTSSANLSAIGIICTMYSEFFFVLDNLGTPVSNKDDSIFFNDHIIQPNIYYIPFYFFL